MPKEPSESFYIHRAQPTVSRQIAVDIAGTMGQRNVSFISNLVAPTSLPPPIPRDPNEFFPMPMDIDDVDIDMDNMDGRTDSESAAIPELPGIHVIGKERAKRYTNSVRLFCI